MSSPAEAVFLQIGEPKTGTTFVQQVLWRNRSLLAGRGLLLPGANPHDHYRATQDLLDMRHLPSDPAPRWEGAWDALAQQAIAAPGRTVISHELISNADEEQVRRATASLASSELHVVLGVRDMATLVPAEWQETVKHRSTVPWAEWVDALVAVESVDPDRRRFGFWRVHDTLAILRLWSRFVDPARIHVLILPPPSAPRDLLWRRFAALVGVDGDGVDLSGARGNASLGVAEAEMLRRTNERIAATVPNWFYMHAVKEPIAHRVLARRPSSGRVRLDAERQDWARGYGLDLAARIAAGPWDVVGDPRELVPERTDAPAVAPEHADPEVMLDAAVSALAASIERQYRLVQDRPDARLVLGRALVRRFPALRRLMGAILTVRPGLARHLGLAPASGRPRGSAG